MTPSPSLTGRDDEDRSLRELSSAAPSHDWMDEARALRATVLWQSNSSIQPLALALQRIHEDAAKAEREACARLAEYEASRASLALAGGVDGAQFNDARVSVGTALARAIRTQASGGER